MISLFKEIEIVNSIQHLKAVNLIGGIRNRG
jgi:hypothetical protein